MDAMGGLISRKSSNGSPTPMPLIALDFDDVLMGTNATVARWHNETYQTNPPMTLSEFYYYHYWKNPHWGTPEETIAKVTAFYRSQTFEHAPPVAGAIEGVRALRTQGYRLCIVTARSTIQKDITDRWLRRYFPGVFEAVYYTGEFELRKDEGRTHVVVKMGKAEVLQSIGASLMVDDSLDHALSCASVSPALPVLLFGRYEWNKRVSLVSSPEDKQSFSQRRDQDGTRFWERDDVRELPRNIRRVANWTEVVRAAREMIHLPK